MANAGAAGLIRDTSDDGLSDSESTPLTQDNYNASQRTVHETKGWDVFRDPPRKIDSGSMANQKCFEISAKILKTFTYLLTFMVVLMAGVIAKGCILLMTSQLKKDRLVPYCNKELSREKQFVTRLPDEERIAWMWCLLFAFMVPELGCLFRSMRICIFKTWKRPPFSHFMLIFLAETFHTIGLAMLVFIILPEIDVVKGAMLTNCLCFIPALLGLLSRGHKDSKTFLKVVVDLFAIAIQATGFFVLPILEQKDGYTLWLIPLSITLISFGWWENYVSSESSLGFMKRLAKVTESFKQTRYFSYIFVSVWKILCFGCSIFVILALRGENVGDFFTKMPTGFGKHDIVIQEIKPTPFGTIPDLIEIIPTGDDWKRPADYNFILYVLLTQIIAAYLCYIFGKFACKIVIQGFSYAFPVNLTVPVLISFLISACGLRNGDPCFFHGTFPDYLFFETPSIYFLNDFISHQHAWIWLLWLLSQTWVTLHIWTPKCERLATTEKLFVSPMYSAVLVDQSMGLNRRRDDRTEVKSEDLDDICREKDEDYYSVISDTTEGSPKKIKSSDKITRIYACATMWHETKDEMMEFLKSILRLDEDQCARRVAQKYLRVVDPDYYEFETHIFFDDAFEISDHNDDDNQVNRFVKLLVTTLDEAASDVHQTRIYIRPPTKYPTPYGGRLEWTLPGKTKMITHLKDKSLIRHRKRWSQVMYMYYLLGHRLMDTGISVDRKAVMAENTYLLTLDGDIDFQPHAVQLLVDLMKKNRNLGAACGRIHPVGSGPMVWYQKFEYAIGHWLQKATEHMIGCVLCSPGCFSLFRGKSLMDDNVMRKYTTQSSQARHYVQYDQGEDRWLCTLLLQRGYRVEYSAASDAYTHCPEGFNEFFNQRRRWVPSTMANIMDLLMDYKRTIKINDNISLPYIAYEMLLMGGTILGPGTIFLMLVGSFVAAFNIDNWTSFYYNIIPILGFILICFTCKSNVQLFVAQILSTMYALVMMAVFVGVALQLGEDGIGSPSAIFVIIMMSSMYIAAALHPQEFSCINPMLIYLLSIPSMYLILILYSLTNLHVVTWGTREVQTKKTKKLFVAFCLSVVYALVMMAVLVGVFLEIKEDGFLAPSSIFFIMMILQLFVTALLHPQEFSCFTHLLFYYILIPSMYLLLVVYSFCNMDNVTWGTREVQTKLSSNEIEEEKKALEEAKRKAKQKSLLSFLQGGAGTNDDEEGSIELSLAGLFKCMFCTHPGKTEEKQHLVHIADSLDSLQKRLNNIERVVDPHSRRRHTSVSSRDQNHLNTVNEDSNETDQNNDTDTDTLSTMPKEERNLLINPYWIEDKDLRKGPVEFLSANEIQFWKDLLDKYLYPIDEDPIEKARIAKDLKDLRDSSVFAFFMLNALFVLIVFLLQLHKDDLHIKWPLGVKTNITYDETTQEARIAAELIELRNKSVFAFLMFNALFVLIVFLLQLNKDRIHINWPLGIKTNITYVDETAEVLISKEYLQLEPIGLVFVFFFTLILVIQFTAMIFHRFGTLSHILASTELSWFFSKKPEELSQDALLDKNAVEIVKELQRLQGLDDYDNDSGSGPDRIGRRKTIHNLQKYANRKRQIGTLDVAFKKRFFQLKANGESNETPVLSRKLTMKKETIKALEVRRNSVIAERKKTHMQTLGAHNEYGVLNNANNSGYPMRNTRTSTASSITARDIFSNAPAQAPGSYVNNGYETTHSDEELENSRNAFNLRNTAHVAFR